MAAAQSAEVFSLAARRRGRKTVSTKDRVTVDRLRQMSFAELEHLYRQLAPPSSLSALNGRKKGHLLALAGFHRTPAKRLINLFGRAPFFPWRGKNFTARSMIKGSGINRINLTIARQEWFAFQTAFRASLVDGRPCISLNYRLKGNPWFIRHLVDEMREVEPGLYLGPSIIKTGKSSLKLVYFAISE